MKRLMLLPLVLLSGCDRPKPKDVTDASVTVTLPPARQSKSKTPRIRFDNTAPPSVSTAPLEPAQGINYSTSETQPPVKVLPVESQPTAVIPAPESVSTVPKIAAPIPPPRPVIRADRVACVGVWQPAVAFDILKAFKRRVSNDFTITVREDGTFSARGVAIRGSANLSNCRDGNATLSSDGQSYRMRKVN